ncbi:MAG TPA: ABC transporter substrate-binding protein [bacterium]|nr:ABC transporter substrate-binding protein [bacterium]
MRRNFALCITLLVAAAGWGTVLYAQESRVGGTWTIVSTEEPDTLDPQKTGAAVAAAIFQFVGEPLLAHDFSNRVVPGLADSWTISSDGLVWTFKLKAGAVFHNGTPITAQAVKASIERAIAPETKSPVAKAQLGPVKAVDAVDARTLRLTLSEPFAPLINNLGDPRLSPIDVRAAESAGSGFGRAPVSDGPYVVKEWVSGHHVTLARNPAFTWGPPYMHHGPAYIDQIIYRFIPDSATQVAAFESGEVSQLGLPPHDVARLQATKKYQIFRFLRKGVGEFLEFNVTKEPFSDIRLRRAMNYAINKDVLVKVVLEGLGEPAYGPLPPSIWGYWPGIVDYAPHYDPAKAKQLFAEAGFTPGPDGTLQKAGRPLAFTLYTTPADTGVRTAQLVQANLRGFGVRMDIQTYEFGTILEKFKKGDQQAGFMGYTYNEPDIMYIWFDSANIGSGLNFSHYADPKLDALIDAARHATNLTKRAAIYVDLQKYVVDKALWVPLWTNYNYIALQPWIKDAKIHPDGYVFLGDAYLTKR